MENKIHNSRLAILYPRVAYPSPGGLKAKETAQCQAAIPPMLLTIYQRRPNPPISTPSFTRGLIYPGTVLHLPGDGSREQVPGTELTRGLPGDGSREKVPGTELTRGRFSIQVFLSILSDQRQVSTLQKVKNQNRT